MDSLSAAPMTNFNDSVHSKLHLISIGYRIVRVNTNITLSRGCRTYAIRFICLSTQSADSTKVVS